MVRTETETTAPSGKALTVTLWVLQIVAAVAFLGAAGAKFAGAALMVAAFEKIGIGQWFRYLTATLEVGGAIGLLFPRYAFYAASLLATVMVGAAIAHLAILGGSPAPAVVLLILTGTIAYLRRPQ
jgi:hypothetical protein